MPAERYTEQDVEEILKNQISKEFMYDKPEVILDNGSLLIEEEIIDSLGIFVLISFIEEQFHIKINPDEVLLDNFENIDTIKSLVMSKLGSIEA
ncbi:MAG: acyl carrier protein [Nostoc sp.]|uniref:acyl carrier protein n=1 Tax=unclassified Nostoc TaxID=2593658 RepID=UPI000CF31442|nr:acyl carrier protein [Nostoc sp. 'Peltigera membranacea cyanobiont' N6]AVH63796.1 acyl carrier protein [Nostoc sp. 'Peltigera membranacea cyanobiont' N6]